MCFYWGTCVPGIVLVHRDITQDINYPPGMYILVWEWGKKKSVSKITPDLNYGENKEG